MGSDWNVPCSPFVSLNGEKRKGKFFQKDDAHGTIKWVIVWFK